MKNKMEVDNLLLLSLSDFLHIICARYFFLLLCVLYLYSNFMRTMWYVIYYDFHLLYWRVLLACACKTFETASPLCHLFNPHMSQKFVLLHHDDIYTTNHLYNVFTFFLVLCVLLIIISFCSISEWSHVFYSSSCNKFNFSVLVWVLLIIYKTGCSTSRYWYTFYLSPLQCVLLINSINSMCSISPLCNMFYLQIVACVFLLICATCSAVQ